MIAIRILNSREVVRSRKGWFLAKFAPLFTDIEKEVEKVVVQELQVALEAQGIKAEITQVPEPSVSHKEIRT